MEVDYWYSYNNRIANKRNTKMKIIISIFILLTITQASQQLIVVTTKNWSTSNGLLQRYSYQKEHWYKVGKSIKVKIGRNGLGWGIGLHKIPRGAKYIKKEGDGKSPAGIFKLKQAFGYKPFKIAYPYKVYKESDHCVDDVNSKFYNRIVDSTKVKKTYKSYENMKFNKNFYKYGIFVDHNPNAKKGAGSCIFIHIKKVPTAGCTAIREDEIKSILKWLDPKKNPLLIQAPKSEIEELLPF